MGTHESNQTHHLTEIPLILILDRILFDVQPTKNLSHPEKIVLIVLFPLGTSTLKSIHHKTVADSPVANRR